MTNARTTSCPERSAGRTKPVSRTPRRGAALVEFAVVSPVLLILVLGMLEIGRAVMVTEVLTYSARMGARTGAISSGSTANAKTAAEKVLTDSGVSGATVQVMVNGSTGVDASAAKSGDEIAVSVTVPYANVTWITTPDYLDGKTLSGRVVMRRE